MAENAGSSRTNDADLTLHVFGSPSLTRRNADGSESTLLKAGKPVALLVYLAAQPARNASRDRLMDLFWSDKDPTGAAHTLRQTVWLLRNTVGDGVLINETDRYLKVGDHIACNRDTFLAAVRHKGWERAIRLHRRPFMEAFATPGGAEFEQWADRQRAELIVSFLEAYEALIKEHLDGGRGARARECGLALRDDLEDDQRAWRVWLDVLVAIGDRDAAQLTADEIRTRFSDLDHRTSSVLRRFEETTFATAPPDRPPPKGLHAQELVGREREFRTILDWWTAACVRRRRIHVHIVAGPGIGKTRFTSDAAVRIRAGGGRVVEIGAKPGERDLEYALAGDLAGAVMRLPGARAISPRSAAELVDLHPPLSSEIVTTVKPAAPADRRRHRSIAIAEAATAAAEEHPVAMFVDDVHWADAASLAALWSAFGRIADAPVFLVTASRPTTVHLPHADATIHLEALDEFGVLELVASIAALPQEEWARDLPRALHRTSQGSPLLILETLQLGVERGWLAIEDDEWSCADAGLMMAAMQQGGALRQRIEDLDRVVQWQLLLMATAGIPLAEDTLSRYGETEASSVGPCLTTLEQRGLATREPSGWRPAHDEVGTMVVEGSPATARARAHARVAHWLTDRATVPRQLVAAVPHLLDAGMPSVLEKTFGRWLGWRRRDGDRRSACALAGAFLGDRRDTDGVSRLVRSLPVRQRWGADRISPTAGAAAVVVVAVAASIVSMNWSPEPQPDATLYLFSPRSDGRTTVAPVPIVDAQWEPGQPLLPQRAFVLPFDVTPLGPGSGALAAAADGTIAYAVDDGGPGGQDVFLVSRGGRPKRITTANGDDTGPAWSPDGKLIAFHTSRWDESGLYDIAVVDAATGVAWPVTSGPALDRTATWSPSGTRIAFSRRYLDTVRPPEACWVAFDRGEDRCVPVEGADDLTVLGWRSETQVAVVSITGAVERLGVLDFPRGLLDSVQLESHSSYFIGPRGKYVVCRCRRPHENEPQWVVAPLDRPEDAQPIAIDGSGAQNMWLAWAPSQRAAYLDRVRIEPPPSPLAVGVPYRLGIRAIGPGGEPFGTRPRLNWSTNDSTLARVDRQGVLTPLRRGVVVVTADAFGWRRHSVPIRIAEPAATTRFIEEWQDGLTAWRPYGDPFPRIVQDETGNEVLWLAGDESHRSGVYSTWHIDPRRGIGFDARVSIPVHRSNWQSVNMILRAVSQPDEMRGWDHVTPRLPAPPPQYLNSCGFGFPSGEGQEVLNDVAVATHRRGLFEGLSVTVDSTLRSGQWFTVRIQLFPDGRCGIAINGKPLVISQQSTVLEQPFRLFMQAKSVDTRIAVGALAVWEGVRTDVDWASW